MTELNENSELQKAHLQRLLQEVSRKELRLLLSQEISKSRRSLASLSLQEDRLQQAEDPVAARRTSSHQSVVHSVKQTKNSSRKHEDENSVVRITSYKHEQNDKFMKLYVSVPGLKPADDKKLQCWFVAKGVTFTLSRHRGRRHEFVLNSLKEEIDPVSSTYRVKGGVVVLFLWKRAQGLRWKGVSTREGHQMKKHLLEYNLFRAEVAAITSSNLSPTGAIELQRVLHKKGFYSITASTSASETLAYFKEWPPKVLVLESPATRDTDCHRQKDSQSPLQGSTDLRENFLKVLSRVEEESSNVFVLLRNLDTFLNPSDYAVDAAQLDALAQKRVVLAGFWGYLSPRDVSRLPHEMTELGLAIANSADAAAVAAMTPPVGLNLMAVFVSSGVDPDKLAPLPGPGLLQLHLYFSDVSLDTVDWMVRCMTKLTYFGNDHPGLCSYKLHWLYLQRCRLTYEQLVVLVMLMNPNALLGIQLDAQHLLEEQKHQLQLIYREHGCQLLHTGG